MAEITGSLPVQIGLIFLVAGLCLFLFPPKKINFVYGYKTPGSMKNLERWNFAQYLSSKLLMLSGILMLITGLAATVMISNQKLISNIGIVESVILMLMVFVKTELALKNKFGRNL